MNIAKFIEHTNLAQNASDENIKKLVEEAIEYGFLGVCVNPDYVKFAHDLISGNDIKLVSVVNFPLGKMHVDDVIAQAKRAIDDGADEIDTVINVSDIKNKKFEKIENEIKKIKNAIKNHNLKVILETDLLTIDEISQASKICKSAGADFVKTSTGFVKNGVGAKVCDIKIMKKYFDNVKASGGIKTKEQAIDLINAGATRLGTSSGVQIVKGE